MSSTIETPQRLLTARELSERLCVSLRQVFRLRSAGRLPAPVRLGGSVRWRERDINDWIMLQCCDQKSFEAGRRCQNGNDERR